MRSYSAAWKTFCWPGLAKNGASGAQIRQPDRIDDVVGGGGGELDQAHALAIGVEAVGFGVDGDDRTGRECIDERGRAASSATRMGGGKVDGGMASIILPARWSPKQSLIGGGARGRPTDHVA